MFERVLHAPLQKWMFKARNKNTRKNSMDAFLVSLLLLNFISQKVLVIPSGKEISTAYFQVLILNEDKPSSN